jgi:hypothetical protein
MGDITNNNTKDNTMLTYQEIKDFILTLDFEDYYDCCEMIEMSYDGEQWHQVQSAFDKAYEIWESC